MASALGEKQGAIDNKIITSIVDIDSV